MKMKVTTLFATVAFTAFFMVSTAQAEKMCPINKSFHLSDYCGESSGNPDCCNCPEGTKWSNVSAAYRQCIPTPEGEITKYQHIKNAAISGHNHKHLKNVSVAQCKEACNREGWCKSFDYYKGKNKCDLSKASYHSVGLKKKDKNNPYDHYSKK